MDAEQIRATWKPRRIDGGDKDASVAMWDSMADDFGAHEIPSFDDDALLRLFVEHDMLPAAGSVLDVACGAGTYSLAIAGRVGSVHGVDISPGMIGRANEAAGRSGVQNATFEVSDWRDLDLDACGMAAGYDLVFAHMTPAIDDAGTFEKLSLASRGWCVLSKPTRRHDPISDALRELLGIADNREDGASDIRNGFNLLWEQGLLPFLVHRSTTWDHKRDADTARAFYLNRMRTYRDLDEDDIARADAYLRSIADAEGRIGEVTDVTVTTLFWHV